MEMKSERLLPADRAAVWSLLNDPEILRQCLPGCESQIGGKLAQIGNRPIDAAAGATAGLDSGAG